MDSGNSGMLNGNVALEVGQLHRVLTCRSLGLIFCPSMWLLWLICFGFTAVPAYGQFVGEFSFVRLANSDPAVDVSTLKRIESHVLPSVVKQGPPRFAELSEYYWAENRALLKRLEQAKHRYESNSEDNFHALTLVAGSAGIGKTFIKRDIFSRSYPAEAICRFDVKDLFLEWQQQGWVESRPDLFCGEVVLNHLPALKQDQPPLMRRFLDSQKASFFVIDSLDEIHPDDYKTLLEQIRQFVDESDRPFLHVVVLGRSLAFRDYWRDNREAFTTGKTAFFMLQPPRFLTTGDLMVSSWNYHTWKFELRYQAGEKAPATMPFDLYERWVKSGYSEQVLPGKITYKPNESMNPEVQALIKTWTQRYPVVNSVFCNLAGNGIIREIAEQYSHENRSFDERAVMEDYLAKWMVRDTKCENRPSNQKPEHLDLYLQLVEAVAIKYLNDGQLDDNGFFHVADDDHVEVVYEGRPLQFPVCRILDRSGLKYLDPRDDDSSTYRFEPVWFHRLMIQKYNDTLVESTKR